MAISVVSFSFSRAAQPEAQPLWNMFSFQHLLTNWSGLQTRWGSRGPLLLGGDFPYHILSPTRLISNSIGGPKGPFCWVVALPTTSFSNFSGPQLTDFLSPPSYIIVQSPTQYLWNGMFDRHQAEITVMQFTGHSLPVHQSMSVPWDFYLVPYFNQPAYAISSHNCQRNVSLPSSASLWNGMFGRIEGQYTTLLLAVYCLKLTSCWFLDRYWQLSKGIP